MRTLTPEEQSQEVARICNVQKWPLGAGRKYPWILPLKNLHTMQIGFIVSPGEVAVPKVYNGNVYSLSSRFEDLPKTEFHSVEEMVKAGWVGD